MPTSSEDEDGNVASSGSSTGGGGEKVDEDDVDVADEDLLVTLYPRDAYYDSVARVALQALHDEREKEGATRAGVAVVKPPHYDLRDLFGYDGDHLTLTLCGDKDRVQLNQDRTFALKIVGRDPTSATDTKTRRRSPRSSTILQAAGVLDGHGEQGHHVAEAGRLELVRRLREQFPVWQKQLQMQEEEEEDGRSDRDGNKGDDGGGSSGVPVVDQQAVGLERFLSSVLKDIEDGLPRRLASEGGATASFAVRCGDRVYLCNAGDSQTIIGARYDDHGSPPFLTVLQTTRLDKPDLPDERRRLEEMGAHRVEDESAEDSARVWYKYVDDFGKQQSIGLAMSRGLGDLQATGVIAQPTIQSFTVDELIQQTRRAWEKQQQKKRRQQEDETCPNPDASEGSSSCTAATATTDASSGVTEPENCGQLSPNFDPSKVQLFAISATDGLLDYRNPQAIVEKIGSSSFLSSSELQDDADRDDKEDGKRDSPKGRRRNQHHALVAAYSLFQEAAKGWSKEFKGSYRDDMAIAVFRILR